MKLILIVLIFVSACSSPTKRKIEKRYEEQAARVTIIRDNWGIPHVYGKTDADAVFGLMYAQCEESFERVERNYMQVLGRMSEAEGDNYLWQDLQMKIIYDTSAAIADYKKAPGWLKDLLQAFADGVNYYLVKHPEAKPRVLKKFEPWYPLLFTDGAYIATKTAGIGPDDLRSFYEGNTAALKKMFDKNESLQGSNAFAIAPSRSAGGNAMLYINPHVSFYFRTEAHLVSEQGLNAYGAVTWGQFFVFQGFNENCGWMHTSSATDVADLYAETISEKDNRFFYSYDGALKAVVEKYFKVSSKGGTGKNVKVYYTYHGPVVAASNGKWLSLKEQNRSMNSLIQSWQRMKAKNFAAFKQTMNIRANGSTNTMYADAEGNIAYWHGNFIPKRAPQFNWSLPVDGSTSATEWQGLHEMNETVHIENPVQGFLQNCNSTPFNAAGFRSIGNVNFPRYMAPEGENFRSLRAIGEIEKEQKITLDKLISIGYDHYLPVFDSLLPPLFEAYNALPQTDPLKMNLKEAVELLQQWDKRSSVNSTAATLAIFWAAQLMATGNGANDQLHQVKLAIDNTSPQQYLLQLDGVMNGLQKIYGSWKVPWGNINRFQKKTGAAYSGFDDGEQSLPVGMASAFFGSLPSYETIWGNGKLQYGVAGNSFVAVVEFVKNSIRKIRAKSITTGGQMFEPGSKHFNDQAQMFIEGKFKDVFFYRDDVERNAEKKYRPGN